MPSAGVYCLSSRSGPAVCRWGCDAFATAALSTFIAKDTTGGAAVTEANKPTEADIVAPPNSRRAKNNMAWCASADALAMGGRPRVIQTPLSVLH